MRKIALPLALAAGLFISQAQADFTGKDATGTTITFKNPNTCSSVVCTPVSQPYDGTNLITFTTAGANGASNTLTGLPTYARMHIFNGTTWDRWTGAITAGSAAITDLGAQADAAAGTDTATASLIALIKRTNQNLTTLNTTAAAPATLASATTGGASTTGNIAANNTTAVVVKASAGTLYGIQVYGIGSAPAYLKIYNATSATCGSGTPVKRIMIPAASTAANGAGSNVSFGDIGVAFGTGITYCVTTGITDADATAPAASTFLINIDYK